MALDENVTAGETGHIAAHATLKAEYDAAGATPGIAAYTLNSTAAQHATIHNALHLRHNALGSATTLPTNLTGSSSGFLAFETALNKAYNVRTGSALVPTSASLFPTQTPSAPNADDGQAITLTTRFSSTTAGSITALRFYAATTLPTTAQGLLYSDTGTVLFQGTYTNIVPGWNTLTLPTPINITTGTLYRVGYFTNGPYVNTSQMLGTVASGPLTAVGGYYQYGSSATFPMNQFNGGCYFADVVFSYMALPTAVPDVPSAPTASALNGQAYLIWNAGSNHNSPVTSYDVQTFTGGAAGAITTTTGVAQYKAVTGLTNNTAYQFRVRATNAVGTSGWSGLSAAATPAATKGLPLPVVHWEGGSGYYAQFPGSQAFNNPAIFPIGVWWGDFASAADVQWDKDHGINFYTQLNGTENGQLLIDNDMYIIQGAQWQTQDLANLPYSDPHWVGWWLADEVDGKYDPPSLGHAEMQRVIDLQAAKAPGGDVNYKFGYANYTGIVTSYFNDTQVAADEKFVNMYKGPVSVDGYYYTDPSGDPANLPNRVDYQVNAPDNAHVRSSAAYGNFIRNLRTRDLADGVLKPLWGFVENGAPMENAAYILPEQEIGAAWSIIRNEGRGIVWFNQSFSGAYTSGNVVRSAQQDPTGPNAARVAAMKTVNNQVQALAPVLNTQSYVWNFGTGAARTETMLKYSGGFAYIFAGIGLNKDPGSATFTVPTGVTGTTVTVLNESRTITISGGQFTDTFDAEYTNHIYRISV